MPSIGLATGINMHYEEAGSGDPVILSYGAAGHHAPWLPQIKPLSRRFRVITPDTRGTGRSDCSASEWSIRVFAEDLVALMDQLGIESAHVGGMSMGSAIAQEVGIRFPERVRSLILCNTWARTDARLALLWEHVLFLTEQAKRASEAERDKWDELLFHLNVFLFFSSDAIANRPEVVQEWWRVYSAGIREETGMGHWKAILAHDTLDRLHQIKAPALVLAGEEDYFTPYYPRQVHDRIPESCWIMLTGPGSSHGLLWERPDEANAAILEFLTEHSGSVS